MNWSLYSQDKFLEPLVFSNGKSQLDVVKEILKAINEGHKLIFLKGICGTGKSAIALNLAKEFNSSSIVVPVKPLQKQYKEDYTNKLYILKNNKEKLKITLIDGRQNHKCPYADCKSNSPELPCTIDFRALKNKDLVFHYLKENEFVDIEDFQSLSDVRRMSIAPCCPYWSPIIPAERKFNALKDSEKHSYLAVNNITQTIYKRKPGCTYYNQFENYLTPNVIIFNSKKYELENYMNRKPATDIEIIDECDKFLDDLCSEKTINLNRLSNRLAKSGLTGAFSNLISEISSLTNEILNDKNLEKNIENKNIFLITSTKVHKLLSLFSNEELISNIIEDEMDYLADCSEIANYFKSLLAETYLTFYKNLKDEYCIKLTTINLEKKFEEFTSKNKIFIMMSGTIHSEKVLKDVFGIKNFKIINAETGSIGKITKKLTNLEKKFNYETYQKYRKEYLIALSKCIEAAQPPILIHVNAFKDLPSKEECLLYNIENLKTEEELKFEQDLDKRGKLIKDFKDKKINILYSTKCNRGVDFPGDICNSIIFTRYPFPSISSLFWRVFKESKPKYFHEFYFDKADREFLQRLYRGLRSKNDHIYLLSPDLRVLEKHNQKF